jgi:hypothetical protein
MPDIIAATENASPLTIGTNFMNAVEGTSKFRDPPDCPWVKVNNLYLSLTQTGRSSWPPLVRQLQGDNRPVTILSGRHGTQIGQAVNNRNGTMHNELFERALYQQDLEERASRGFNHVEVIDVGLDQYRTTKGLRTLASEKLESGRTVIFAWCHSLFAMTEYDGDAPQKVLISHLNVSVNQSVASIVELGYGWVPA